MSEQNRINISVIIGTLSLIASMLTSIFFTPFLLERVGDSEYGLKSLADSFVSFATVFTTGISSVFIYFHKKYGVEGEGKVIGAFNIIFSVIAGVIIIFGLVLLGLTSAGILLSSELYTAEQIHTFAVILAITILFTAASTILGVFRHYDESNKLLIIVRLIDLLVVVAYPTISIPLLLNGANIIVITSVYVSAQLGGYLAYAVFAIARRRKNYRENPDISRISWPSFALIKEILVFSLATMLISAFVIINSSVDKIILGAVSGAEAVTMFQLSWTLNSVLFSASSVLYVPYLPAATESYITGDMKKVQSIYTKGSTVLAFVAFSVLFGFIFAGQDFINAWVGEEKAEVYVNTIILFSTWPIYGIARFSDSLSKCANRQKVPIVIFGTGLALHLLITLSLVQLIGIWACFIGLSGSMLYMSIAFFVFDVKILKVNIVPLMRNLLKFIVAGAISLAISFLLDRFLLNGLYPSNYWLSTIMKCLIFLFFWIGSLVALFWKETKAIFISIFVDQHLVDDNGNEIIKPCMVSKIKGKFRKKRQNPDE